MFYDCTINFFECHKMSLIQDNSLQCVNYDNNLSF